jgi:hypothetical protein
MVPDNDVDLERELAAVMTEEVAGLPAPRVDLGRIRRRRAVRRRLLVPAVVALVGALATGSLTLARGGIDFGRPAPSGPAGRAVPTVQPAPEGGAGRPAHPSGPTGGATSSPAVRPGEAGQGEPGGGAVPPEGCARVRGPLPAAARAALLTDATAACEDARREVAGVLGPVERLSFAARTVDRLLPAAGSAVRLVECGGRVDLAPAERAAVLGRVRSVVVAAGVVIGAVLEETVGKLDLGAAAATPVAVAVAERTGASVVLDARLGGGPVAPMGTVAITVRLADSKVTRVDLRGLDLGGLGLGALGLLQGLSLPDGLGAVQALAGVGALTPAPSSVVAADVETLLP